MVLGITPNTMFVYSLSAGWKPAGFFYGKNLPCYEKYTFKKRAICVLKYKARKSTW